MLPSRLTRDVLPGTATHLARSELRGASGRDEPRTRAVPPGVGALWRACGSPRLTTRVGAERPGPGRYRGRLGRRLQERGRRRVGGAAGGARPSSPRGGGRARLWGGGEGVRRRGAKSPDSLSRRFPTPPLHGPRALTWWGRVGKGQTRATVSFIQPTPSLGVYFLLFMFISVGHNAKC